jgi:hypothetical protein
MCGRRRYARPDEDDVGLLLDGSCQKTATRYLRTVVTADRSRQQAAKPEEALFRTRVIAPAGSTRLPAECLALLCAKSLACSLNCEVCWDAR